MKRTQISRPSPTTMLRDITRNLRATFALFREIHTRLSKHYGVCFWCHWNYAYYYRYIFNYINKLLNLVCR